MAGCQVVALNIDFGQFAPDLPIFKNPGLSVATNIIPKGVSYGPFAGFSAVSSALSAQCYGAGTGLDTGHNTYIYCGDRTKLYSIIANVPTDISKAGGYTLASDGKWEFTQFGLGGTAYFIATNYDDAVQYISPGGTINADLIASADKPKFRHIGVVRNFLVGGNSNDTTDGVRPNRVWWSKINDPTDFTPSAVGQGDYEDLKSGGWVMRVLGNREFGLIFTEKHVIRMSYIGPPAIWSFDVIDEKRGTPIPGSVIQHGRQAYYIADDGFMRTDGAGESVPIGHNRVDKYFWDQYDLSNRNRVWTAVDAVKKIIWWLFPGTGNAAGMPNIMLGYAWADDKWCEAQPTDGLQLIFPAVTQGYTLEQLDALYPQLDDIPYSLDSLAWTGGLFRLAGFDTSHQYGTFTGANLAATIETGELNLGAGKLFKTEHVRPLIDGGTITGNIAGRKRLVDTASFGTAQSLEADGTIKVMNENRYQKFRSSIAASGTWQHATGIEVEGVATGDF